MGQHDVGKRMDFVGEVRWSERAGRTTRTDAGLVKKSCTHSRLQDNISPGLGVSENQNVRARMLPSSVDMRRTTSITSAKSGKRYPTEANTTRQAIAHGSQTAQGDCSLVDDDREDRSRDRRDHPW
jgi:hypothetical protein